MAQNGSKKDTAKWTDTLWTIVDVDTDEIVRTKDRGLLAVYVTRADARNARKAGRVRTEGTRVVPFCEYMEE